MLVTKNINPGLTPTAFGGQIQFQASTTLHGYATQDAPVHQNVKEAIVNASELDTRLIMRSLTNTERVLNNEAVERLMEKEKALGDQLRFEDIVDEVAGVYPKIMHEGTMEVGAWSCGMVAGLVNDIPTVEELVHGIMAEADSIIKNRLNKF